MATSIVMPKLGFIMTEGTVVEWLRRPGDRVAKGEPLVVVQTEKATVETEAPATGMLSSRLAAPGSLVPVATIIGYILEAGEELPPNTVVGIESIVDTVKNDSSGADGREQAPAVETQDRDETHGGVIVASPSAKRLAREQNVDLAKVAGTGPQGRIVDRDVLAYLDRRTISPKDSSQHISPAARNLAIKLGVDLSGVVGTGPGGRVLIEDVNLAASASACSESKASVPAVEKFRLNPIQKIAAERMGISFRTAPHFYLELQVDMYSATSLRLEWLPTVESATGRRLSFSDLLVAITAKTLKGHPDLNATYEGDQIAVFRDVNVGLAVDTPQGLTVPVIHGADQISLVEIVRKRAELVERARNGRLTLDDITGGTFTISNLGMFGIDSFQAIINPPQTAILALGRIARRPVVIDDGLYVRPTMMLTLSVDHRVADGAKAARFLKALVDNLENPRGLLML